MIVWRPANTISVKALALIWQNDALLLADVYDDNGHIKGMRPLGGTVEFGEPWSDALQREFLEELDVRISLLDTYFVMENLYEHHGVMGHEIVFLCHAHFLDSRYYQMDSFSFKESDETSGIAKWMTLDELASRKLELFPAGLRDRLASTAHALQPRQKYS